jgi:hypothetical protein
MATKRLPRRRDPLQLGKLIVDIATGQVEDRVEDEKDPAAADLGRRGGQARAKVRMHIRRFTRLTNAFSKKAENHAHSVALNFMYYNFVRIHSKLRVTPATAAGVTDRLWEIADIAALIDAREWPPKKRGPYKPRAPKQRPA